MIALPVTALVLVFLLFAEHLRRVRKYSSETTRKFVHITVGTFVAFWPFFLSELTIQLACIAFLLAIITSRYFDIFPSIHRVSRKTWGDILFPVGIAAALLLTNSPWIFVAAMLHLSLGDGLAALVGLKFGMKRKFEVFGYTKTALGTLTFFVISTLIMAWFVGLAPLPLQDVNLAFLLLLPVLATGVELISTNGSDNIFVPIVVTVALNSLVAIS